MGARWCVAEYQTGTGLRVPCVKLGIRFGRPDIVKRFLRSGRTAFYFAVVSEGELGAGDAIELLTQAEEDLTVANVVNLYAVDTENQELIRRAIQSSALPESWRDYFRKRLWEPDVRPNSLWWTSAALG